MLYKSFHLMQLYRLDKLLMFHHMIQVYRKDQQHFDKQIQKIEHYQTFFSEILESRITQKEKTINSYWTIWWNSSTSFFSITRSTWSTTNNIWRCHCIYIFIFKSVTFFVFEKYRKCKITWTSCWLSITIVSYVTNANWRTTQCSSISRRRYACIALQTSV